MDFNRDLEMLNVGCFQPDEPLNTHFVLVFGDQEKPCPRFHGKVEDKKKVYHELKNEIRPEVHSKWDHLKCHCQWMPKMRLSKTARNLNKVSLTCIASATNGTRCKYFQWIHTLLYPLPSDPMPEWLLKGRKYKRKPMKSINKESQEWMQQTEQNVEQWKLEQSSKEWLNRSKNKTNSGKPRQSKVCQVVFIGVQTLQRSTRNMMSGNLRCGQIGLRRTKRSRPLDRGKCVECVKKAFHWMIRRSNPLDFGLKTKQV